jgi:hypothetical protein
MHKIKKFADAWKVAGTKHDWKWFKKKPIIIKAIKIDKEFEIDTLKGTMKGNAGDWLIKGIKGELYPCKPDVFQQTYEDANAENKTQGDSE